MEPKPTGRDDHLHGPIPSNASDFACIDLINSAFTDYLGIGNRVDRVTSPEWQAWFLDRHDLQPETSAETTPLEELVTLRRDLRRILDRWSAQLPISQRDAQLLDRRVRQATLRQRVKATPEGLALRQEPVQRDWAWVLATIAASAATLLSVGDPRRLKTCTNPACSWMFYDPTVNRSKQFCSTTPCASLIRVRRFRQRD